MSHFCTDKRGFGWYFGHLSVGSWLSREPLVVESSAGRHSKAPPQDALIRGYAKFSGAARRHFPAICEKPMGGAYVPPAVRGLTLNRLGGVSPPPLVFFKKKLLNPNQYRHETWHDSPDINSTSFGVKKSDSDNTILRYSRFCDVTLPRFWCEKDKYLKIRQKYVCGRRISRKLHKR